MDVNGSRVDVIRVEPPDGRYVQRNDGVASGFLRCPCSKYLLYQFRMYHGAIIGYFLRNRDDHTTQNKRRGHRSRINHKRVCHKDNLLCSVNVDSTEEQIVGTYVDILRSR